MAPPIAAPLLSDKQGFIGRTPLHRAGALCHAERIDAVYRRQLDERSPQSFGGLYRRDHRNRPRPTGGHHEPMPASDNGRRRASISGKKTITSGSRAHCSDCSTRGSMSVSMAISMPRCVAFLSPSSRISSICSGRSIRHTRPVSGRHSRDDRDVQSELPGGSRWRLRRCAVDCIIEQNAGRRVGRLGADPIV